MKQETEPQSYPWKQQVLSALTLVVLLILIGTAIIGCGSVSDSPAVTAPTVVETAPTREIAIPTVPTVIPPTSTPTSIPTPVPAKGLNITRAQIQSAFEGLGFEFSPPRTLRDGNSTVAGMSYNAVAILELTGPTDNLTKVDLILDFSDAQGGLVENAIYMTMVLVLVAPSWDGSGGWVADNIDRAVREGEVSTRRGNVVFALWYLEALGILTLSVEAV